jgi:hypothetical protein
LPASNLADTTITPHNMKRASIAVLLGLLFLNSAAFADATSVTSASQTDIAATALTEPDPARFDVRVQPVGLLYGIWGADLDVGVGDYWALGGSVSEFTTNESGNHNGLSDIYAWEFGIYGTIFINGKRFTNAWFVRPGLYFTPVSENSQTVGTHTLSNISLATIVGHQWVLHGHLNATFGLGLEIHQIGSSSYFRNGTGGITNPTSSGSEVQPVMELSVGWTL